MCLLLTEAIRTYSSLENSIYEMEFNDEKILVKNGDRDVALYVFEPDILTEKKLPVIYYMHGGGYIMGDARMNENVLKDIANKNNVKIISVEYTLATELPFPQDLEDSYVGLKYLFENAESLGINEKKSTTEPRMTRSHKFPSAPPIKNARLITSGIYLFFSGKR